MADVKTSRWLNWAAVATWVVVSLPALFDIVSGELDGIAAALWVIAFLIFGIVLTFCLWASRPMRGRAAVLALFLETVSGLTMVYVSRSGTPGATLVIVAAQLPYFVGQAAWAWAASQTVALGAIFWTFGGAIDALSGGVALGGFQMFAVATSLLALSERAAREELTRANAELTATRGLLAENARAAERLRISRDLHDALGHHLTALSLQLDVASRLTTGQAAEHVLEAHAVTRLLLSDVRSVVSELREAGAPDLASALHGLTAHAGALQVHLDIQEPLELHDARRSHALLRSVQEIITNASRHAQAHNLWIQVRQTERGVAIDAHDDGRGADAVTWGNGLTGMRERFEAAAGRVDIVSTPGRGFEVHGFLPRAEPL